MVEYLLLKYKLVVENRKRLYLYLQWQNSIKYKHQCIECVCPAAPAPSATSGFYLIPESDLFVCGIWICSLFYLYMGQNYQDVKYALFMSHFDSFHGDPESKWAMGGLRKKYLVDKYTKESNGIALFFYCNFVQFKTMNKYWFVKR